MDAYWRASNYLSIGQIYLQDNPLLEEPLRREHIKPRLLGQWGTTTGLNFIYVHLNRLIVEHDLNMIYVMGPGHGGPGPVAQSYLEGSYTERYPDIERNRNGMQRLFRQFSWPYGIPSHVAPETPGSIHEGGEHDALTRTNICRSLSWLGIDGSGTSLTQPDHGRPSLRVLAANEEEQIARHTAANLAR
jgi:xylulose-5-phosphate/fructose-6-phosphate phosphoketolase